MIRAQHLKLKAFSVLIFSAFIGCIESLEPGSPGTVQGYIPVYGDETTTEIKVTTARTVKNPGKIYSYGSYLLVNEINQGIHVFDNTNPAEPEALSFIEIVGNTDLAIRDNVLYANHMGSLVALTTINFVAVEQIGALTISNWLLGVPPPRQQYFQCVEPGKGVVIAWQKQTLKNPECYAH
jgi:hypothetical protein